MIGILHYVVSVDEIALVSLFYFYCCVLFRLYSYSWIFQSTTLNSVMVLSSQLWRALLWLCVFSTV